MYALVEILKYSLPAIILAIAWYIINKERGRRLSDGNEEEKQKEWQHERQIVFLKTILPLKVQAYERIVLLLERITPQNLIMRVNRPGMTAMQLKSALTANIREEFEHNMSQQVYISVQAWELVSNAKEDMINLINTSFAGLPQNASSSDLIRNIFDKYISVEKPAVIVALHAVRQEFANQEA